MPRTVAASVVLVALFTSACNPAKPLLSSGLALELHASQFDSALGGNLVCSLTIGVPGDTTTGRDTTVSSVASVQRMLTSSQGVTLASAATQQPMQLSIRITAESAFVALPVLGVSAATSKPFVPYIGTSGPWLCDDTFPLVDDPAFHAAPLRGHSATGTWHLYLVVPIG